MANLQQSNCKVQKYRYSISQLIELSATARYLFDLSKFSYEAARAGVVPSLGDCAMSSRKSSAGGTGVTNIETASTSDLLVFQGNRLLRPDRQPSLPPPAERQKDEGFARFLKKHSSPTHNRVTAGGRIVPMEPRSPPTFSLPSIVTNRPQAHAVDKLRQDSVKKSIDSCWSSATQIHQIQNNCIFDGPSAHDCPLEFGTEFGTNQTVMYPSPSNYPNPYDANMAIATLPNPAAYPSPVHMTFPMLQAQAGAPVTQQSVQCAQHSMNPHYNTNMTNWGVAMPFNEQHNGTNVWSLYNQGLGQQAHMHQVMSPLQLLTAWEQHYADLDQQLRNIDRHRAMHNLDPRLAEQRRVIVQQRSDAKDTVREYQAMLGVRRNFDSSQESWTTAFNADAPIYIPQTSLGSRPADKNEPSFDFSQNALLIEKPRAQSHRRAIPIKPPPEEYDRCKFGEQGRVQDHRQIRVNEWRVPKGTTHKTTEQESRDPSKVLMTEQMRQLSITQESPYVSENGDVNLVSSAPCDRDSGFEPENSSEVDDSNGLLKVISADENPPRDIQDEYRRLIEAVNQSKGTLTKVRLLDSRVIDVKGQGLGLMSACSLANERSENVWPNAGSTQEHSSLMSVREDCTSATPHSQLAFTNNPTNKENVSVTPRGHQKAATDAFLAQFNAVENNMALAVRPTTQSLRTASNGHIAPDSFALQYTNKPSRSMESYKTDRNESVMGYGLRAEDSGVADMDLPALPDALNHKGYSSAVVQNIHAIGSLPNNYDGAIEARQSVQTRLTAASKAKSPRFIRRQGGKGGA